MNDTTEVEPIQISPSKTSDRLQQEIDELADDMVARGERPTTERVRQVLGRSPNLVHPRLQDWKSRFEAVGRRLPSRAGLARRTASTGSPVMATAPEAEDSLGEATLTKRALREVEAALKGFASAAEAERAGAVRDATAAFEEQAAATARGVEEERRRMADDLADQREAAQSLADQASEQAGQIEELRNQLEVQQDRALAAETKLLQVLGERDGLLSTLAEAQSATDTLRSEMTRTVDDLRLAVQAAERNVDAARAIADERHVELGRVNERIEHVSVQLVAANADIARLSTEAGRVAELRQQLQEERDRSALAESREREAIARAAAAEARATAIEGRAAAMDPKQPQAPAPRRQTRGRGNAS